MAFVFLSIFGCKQSREQPNEPLPEIQMENISYGPHPGQVMDLYLPEGRSMRTRTLVLIHGGGWSSGSRKNLAYLIPLLRSTFPDCAIANIDYRLATAASPAFPKQIDDLQSAIRHLREADYDISEEFGLIGVSAGAHLALLYSYRFDAARSVRAVASIVGPVDFTDPAYTSSPYFHYGLSPLIGTAVRPLKPEHYLDVSPAAHVSEKSAPTILFYGGKDALIPSTQGPRLKARLDEAGIASELHLYPNEGHGNWDLATTRDMSRKLNAFFGRYLLP